MKTQTKSQIVKIITKKGRIRPSDLAKLLKITPQALHRHLKSLVTEKIIQSHGSSPKTVYEIIGRPDLEKIKDWFCSSKITQNPSDISETRDVFQGRLNKFKDLKKSLQSDNLLALIISTAGEIGNNSFDHNMGQWSGVPGCWFNFQISGKFLWIVIADRGQGIFKSLSKVDASIKNDDEALKIAFEKQISGRSPERRGNGLKYVLNNILGNENRGIACHSGRAQICYGNLGMKCLKEMENFPLRSYGTFTLMCWGIK